MESGRGNADAHVHSHRPWHDEKHRIDRPEEFLPKLLPGKDLVIADIGCGRGYYAQYLIGYSSLLYCVDIDKEELTAAESRFKGYGKRVRFLVSTSAIPAGSVDVILYANSFHDIGDKDGASEEADRILKPRGRIIVVDWKKDTVPFGPPRSIRMDEADYLGFFSGFKTMKRFEPDQRHFGLVLRRA